MNGINLAMPDTELSNVFVRFSPNGANYVSPGRQALGTTTHLV